MRQGSALLVVLFAAVHGLAACVSSAPAPAATEPPPITPPTEDAMKAAPSALADAQAWELLFDLGGRDREAGAQALASVLEAQDTRFIPVLIEILRGSEIGLDLAIDYQASISGLENQ